jgi:transposase
MATDKKTKRRRYSGELKAQVLTECEAPGVSVAKVAMAHGINANIVHGWRQTQREARQRSVAQSHQRTHDEQTQFVPVTMSHATPQALAGAESRVIEVELHRGALTMKLTWPATASLELAAWTRELLR